MMMDFTIFPAIDIRDGKVVRLKEGDPLQQTDYASNPAEIAARFLDAGATWLHVVNLDGAFEEPDAANKNALAQVLKVTQKIAAHVQYGGGIRSLADIESLIGMGIDRVILGTAAIQDPNFLADALEKWGDENIGLSLDARDGIIRVRGWKETTEKSALETAVNMAKTGLKWLVFTDIARDGLQTGLNLNATIEIAAHTHLNVIASGGVKNMEDIRATHKAKLAGVIVGRALYEGTIDVLELFQTIKK